VVVVVVVVVEVLWNTRNVCTRSTWGICGGTWLDSWLIVYEMTRKCMQDEWWTVVAILEAVQSSTVIMYVQATFQTRITIGTCSDSANNNLNGGVSGIRWWRRVHQRSRSADRLCIFSPPRLRVSELASCERSGFVRSKCINSLMALQLGFGSWESYPGCEELTAGPALNDRGNDMIW